MKIREVSTCIIFNHKKEVLLQKKTLDYPFSPNGPWLFFGGHIEENENATQAIKRELKEELGQEFNVQFWKKETFNLQNGSKVIENIFISFFEGEISKLSLREGAGFAFFDISELDSLNSLPEQIKLIKDYFKENPNT